MALPSDPNYSPKGNLFFPIAVSVSSEASAVAAGVGPFTGLYVKVSTSFTVIGINGISLQVNDQPRNPPILWIQGAYLSAINSSAATATAAAGAPLIYGLL